MKRFNEFVNESMLGRIISFPATKSWDFTKIKGLVDRAFFKIVDKKDDKLYLENDKESMCIDADCNITNFIRNGHEMKQTYLCDEITKRQVKRGFKNND